MDRPDIAKPITVSSDGTNYVLWAQEMSSFLRGRKLWRYVTGDIVEPQKKQDEDSEKFKDRLEEWDCKNHQILTWFRNTCEPAIKRHFGRLETAKEVWDMLAKRYSTSDIAHQFQLLGQLHHLKQEPGQSVSDFLSQLQAIWDQLAVSDPNWYDPRDAELYIQQ